MNEKMEKGTVNAVPCKIAVRLLFCVCLIAKSVRMYLRIQKAESEEKEKQDKLNYEKSYYAKWRFVYACDSLLLDWQLDNGVSSDQKVEAMKAKAEALEASGDCKNLLAKYDCVVARFIKIFGEAEQ